MMRRGHFGRSNGGVTIVELLITIGIILLLAGLTLPAVQKAREQANLAACSANMRQIGLSLQNYHSNHGMFPTSLAPVGSVFELPKMYSVHTALLPYCDLSAVYDEINFEIRQNFNRLESMPENNTAMKHRLSIFLCPSDPQTRSGLGANSYRANVGGDANNETGPFAQYRYVRPEEVVDGMGSTVAFSEKILGTWGDLYDPRFDILYLDASDSMNPPWPTEDEWLIDCRFLPTDYQFTSENGRTWFISTARFTLYNHVAPPNSEVVDCIRPMGGTLLVGSLPARSYHTSVVNATFLDGSVRRMSNTISLRVWRASGTCAGSEL